ncbi:hypothetical protein E1202_30530 [Saccharopolyspora karakumensis]|uniref:Phosphodiesterase n=1 Tax=Saccharopolyspora karakumensis TaxID=2530386 RepID=A0A4R5B998_9PSEU|nr:hypothetical protein E1202_30530 [Saccharopolyspora karakumensis]
MCCPAAAAGAVMGGLFGALARLRRGKPLHPHGTVYEAVLRRTGAPQPWFAEWLDEAGEDHGLVRISRSMGLPELLPDVFGLAFTFSGPSGDRHDLLLATTGLRPSLRYVLLPHLNPLAGTYGSLLPYRAGRGLVLLAAVPLAPADSVVASFRLLTATPTGRWRPFGRLDLTGRTGARSDQPLRFDPVLHVLPGLAWPSACQRIREPAYAAARREQASSHR